MPSTPFAQSMSLSMAGVASRPERRVQRYGRDVRRAALKDEARHDGDAQVVLDHGEYGHVEVGGELGLLGYAGDTHGAREVLVRDVGGGHVDEEGLALEAADGKDGSARHGMGPGQDSHHRVVLDADGIEAEVRLEAGEGDVYASGAEPLLHLGAVALQQLDGDAGVALLEGLKYAGHPAQGYAGIGADADRAAFRAAGQGQLLLQPVRGLDQLAHKRREALALGREPHAAVAAHEQREARLLLKRVHNMRHARLRVAQVLSRL